MIKVEDLKIGTKVRCVNGIGWVSFNAGDILTVTDFGSAEVYLDHKRVSRCYFHDFELIEDKSKWHKHHDMIIAWAKGQQIQRFGKYGLNKNQWILDEYPTWDLHTQYRIKPEKSEKDIQIENLEKQSKELVDMQKELADKISKLKENDYEN